MKPSSCLSLIVIFLLMFGQTACSKKKPDNTDSSALATGSTNGVDRTRAQEYVTSGREFYRTDQDDKAIEAFEQAVKLDPEYAEAHFRLGLAYDAVGQEQEAEESYKKAIEKYKKQLESNSEDAEAHYNLGQAYAGRHLYSEAVREYRLATNLKGDDSDMYYDLGKALSKLAQYDQAVVAFSKSLEIDPENARSQDALEEAREGVQRIKSGRKHQEDLLKKQKAEELRKAEAEGTAMPTSSPRPGSTRKP